MVFLQNIGTYVPHNVDSQSRRLHLQKITISSVKKTKECENAVNGNLWQINKIASN